MCAERNWSTRGVLPERSPELERRLASATTPEQVREICLAYAAERGTVVMTPDGVHAHATGKTDPAARGLSRIVELPSGRRVLIDGARSEAELNQAEAELRSRG